MNCFAGKLIRRGRKRIGLCWLAFMGFGLFVGNLAAQESDVETSKTERREQTTLWKIESPQNTVYLLGSIHILRPQDHPLPEQMREAYDAADELVVEVSQKEMGPAATMMLMEKGQYSDGSTMKEHVSEEAYQALRERLRELNMPATALDQYKPWFAGLMLAVFTLIQEGFSQESGVEVYFEGLADADEKPVTSLETAQEQVELLSGISDSMGDDLLLQMVEESETISESLDEMVRLWKTGKTEELAGLLNAQLKNYPQLREKLLVERNRNWIPRIQEKVGAEKDVLVVVGAGHLVGDDSVVAMLRERGLDVVQQ